MNLKKKTIKKELGGIYNSLPPDFVDQDFGTFLYTLLVAYILYVV